MSVDMCVRLGAVVLAVVCGLNAGPANCEQYPMRPVKLIVPWATGGGADQFARMVAERLSVKWKQPVVVENRPGASGNIGAEAVARSAPDGYTIMLTPDTVVTTASLYKKLPFDPSQDLTPITLAASFPYVLVVRKDLPVTNTAELIALAKSSPGSLNYASAGAGSPFHLAAELFKSIGQVDIVGIPYKGGGPALVDVVSGRVDLAFANLGNVMPLIKAGRLKALAVTTTGRSAVASDLPTLEESGVPGYNFAANFAFFAPRGVPKDVVNQIHADIAAVLASADVRARLSSADGAEIVANSPDEFHSLLESEHLKWTRIIKAAGITAD